jgi:dephospho-CoA kinase
VKSLVLAFSGSIGSGKSTLSLSVAKALNWPYVSFGNHVRTVALLRGLGESREVLQEVGESLIQEGWEQFCKSVLAQTTWEPGEPLVVDGIRHVEAVETLQLLIVPSELLLIHITLNEPTRKARLYKRDVLMCLRSRFHVSRQQKNISYAPLLPGDIRPFKHPFGDCLCRPEQVFSRVSCLIVRSGCTTQVSARERGLRGYGSPPAPAHLGSGATNSGCLPPA